MEYRLTDGDKHYIWQVVRHAAEQSGGYHQLFSMPLDFAEADNKIEFNWPVWIRAIKVYISSRYGDEALKHLLLEILAEVYNPESYRQHIEKAAINSNLEVIQTLKSQVK